MEKLFVETPINTVATEIYVNPVAEFSQDAFPEKCWPHSVERTHRLLFPEKSPQLLLIFIYPVDTD